MSSVIQNIQKIPSETDQTRVKVINPAKGTDDDCQATILVVYQ